jgi:hypothetical protein
MLVVAAQLPTSVLAADPDPEASAGSASASNAQIPDATDLMLTANPPFICSRDENRKNEWRPLLQNP